MFATIAAAEFLGLGAAFLSAGIFFIIAFFSYPQA